MKVIVEKDDLLLWQLPRKVYEAEKDESMKEMLSWFLVRKPNYNLPCLLGGSYFGVLPDYGYSCEYALARSVCPVFFSTFAYEEMLLLLAAFFCEKTLVFISRSESTATLCALFLLSILSPFRFNGPLLLNCDSEKAETMIFEFPFAMLATLKTTKENLQNILSSFIACN